MKYGTPGWTFGADHVPGSFHIKKRELVAWVVSSTWYKGRPVAGVQVRADHRIEIRPTGLHTTHREFLHNTLAHKDAGQAGLVSASLGVPSPGFAEVLPR
jgi:hypothetical protein